MNEHKAVPNIRFNGFEDEWRRITISEVGSVATGNTPSTKQARYYSKKGVPWITPSNIEKNGKVYNVKYLSNEGEKIGRIVPKGSVLVTSIASIGKNTLLKEDSAFNQQINAITPNKKYNSYFLYTACNQVSKKMKDIASAGTMQIVNKKEFSRMLIICPLLLEQEKIGNFFAKLDKLLDLQQQKIDKLELLKKTLLQKLFPKHDAKIPELRFKGYEGNWKKHKLKELASFLKGKGYSKNDIVHYGFPIILYGRMYTNYRLNIKFIDDTFVKDDKNSVKSVEGDVIIPASGETAEEISIASNIKRSGIIIGGDLNIIRPDNKLIDSSFLALVLSNGKVKQQIAKRAQGKSIVHIHNTDLMPLEIDFPSLNEQQKIGDLLSKVDQLIELENKKLEDLRQVKKCLLQNMFV